jgi:purine-binding chemotaxis protein CheW
MSDKQQFCTFFADNLLFGVAAEQVQEVIRFQPMTPVALAPRSIRGLINLRGQIVTAVDLRSLLELTIPTGEYTPMNVVVRTFQGAFSLLVDRIDDVLELEQDSFECPPDTLEGMSRELISGAYKLTDRLLLILDVDRLVSSNILKQNQVA